MLIEEPISNETYQKLLQYIFQKCSKVTLTKYHPQYEIENKSEIKKILLALNPCNQTKDKLISQFQAISFDEFDDMESELCQEENKHKYIKELDDDTFETLVECKGKITRQSNINPIIYDTLTESWITKNRNNIFYEKTIKTNHSLTEKPHLIDYATTYYLKLNEQIKKEILEKKSLYDWCFPHSLEDIKFFRNDYCFLCSIAHEQICEIYPENKEEYEYLKSIGIKFVKDEFVETPREELYYKNYDILRP